MIALPLDLPVHVCLLPVGIPTGPFACRCLLVAPRRRFLPSAGTGTLRELRGEANLL